MEERCQGFPLWVLRCPVMQLEQLIVKMLLVGVICVWGSACWPSSSLAGCCHMMWLNWLVDGRKWRENLTKKMLSWSSTPGQVRAGLVLLYVLKEVGVQPSKDAHWPGECVLGSFYLSYVYLHGCWVQFSLLTFDLVESRLWSMSWGRWSWSVFELVRSLGNLTQEVGRGNTALSEEMFCHSFV